MHKNFANRTIACGTECVIEFFGISTSKLFACFRAFASVLALTILCGAGASLSGCSTTNTHQIIDSNQACVSCHSDEKTTYDVSSPKGIIETGAQIVVKTSADKVAVCKPTFISEDGSKFVPVACSTTTTNDGQADITLDEGTWVLGIEEDGSSKSQVVYVSNQTGSSDATIIEL